MRLKTLIADDESLARERLRYLLSADEEIEVAGECRNGREVVAYLKANPIDLLFLDIQMPGGSGFDVITQIGLARIPLIVFVTAHDQYAVKAFEVQALDYLTKPVESSRLQAALSRVKERAASKAALLTQDALKEILAGFHNTVEGRDKHPTRLLVSHGTRDSFVQVNDIEWIEAADYYACLHVGAKTFMVREAMKELATTLDPRRFVRIHRGAIVNVDHVREVVREGRSEGCVILANGQRLKLSKAGWQALLSASRK